MSTCVFHMSRGTFAVWKSITVYCVDSDWWYFVFVVRCRLRLEFIFQPVGGILLPLVADLEKSSNLLHRGILWKPIKRELHHIYCPMRRLFIYIHRSLWNLLVKKDVLVVDDRSGDSVSSPITASNIDGLSIRLLQLMQTSLSCSPTQSFVTVYHVQSALFWSLCLETPPCYGPRQCLSLLFVCSLSLFSSVFVTSGSGNHM